MRFYYIIIIWKDVEPSLYGPYKDEASRDRIAIKLKKMHRDEHGIFMMDSKDPEVNVNTYNL